MLRSLILVCALVPALSSLAIEPRAPSQNRPKNDTLGHENRYTNEMRMSSSGSLPRSLEKGDDGNFHRRGYWDPSGRWISGEITDKTPDRFGTTYPRSYGLRRSPPIGRTANGF